MVEAIDRCIVGQQDEALTLQALSHTLGYSEFHTTRKFRALSGMSLRDYLRLRRLAFALIDVRDSRAGMLEIAVKYGFSSQEAFTRAFKAAYGITPSQYRKHPAPVVLRTKITVFDRYILGIGEIGMVQSTQQVKVYFITIPAHRFLHIKNYQSNGYFDFWSKQEHIAGQDCHTICGLLDSIKGKMDGDDSAIGVYSGQLLARLYEADGRTPEAYGVRLPQGYDGALPPQMLEQDIPAGEYIVFEHGSFDYDQQGQTVGEKLGKAMADFNFEGTGYQPDTSAGRVAYFYHDPSKYMKWVKPVVKQG